MYKVLLECWVFYIFILQLIYDVNFRCIAALGFKVSSAPVSRPETQVCPSATSLWAPLGCDDSLDAPVLVT